MGCCMIVYMPSILKISLYVIFGVWLFQKSFLKVFFKTFFLNSRWRIRNVGYSFKEKNPKWFHVQQHLCCKLYLASFIAFYKNTNIFCFVKIMIWIYFSRSILASWKLKQRNQTRLHQLNWQRSKSLKER